MYVKHKSKRSAHVMPRGRVRKKYHTSSLRRNKMSPQAKPKEGLRDQCKSSIRSSMRSTCQTLGGG